jgi:hypothetical protein
MMALDVPEPVSSSLYDRNPDLRSPPKKESRPATNTKGSHNFKLKLRRETNLGTATNLCRDLPSKAAALCVGLLGVMTENVRLQSGARIELLQGDKAPEYVVEVALHEAWYRQGQQAKDKN